MNALFDFLAWSLVIAPPAIILVATVWHEIAPYVRSRSIPG